jgi:class 3 adenylate cyclase/tetratricopeptide (TPR) repeat protein
MRCVKCGAENPGGLKFCEQCAAPFKRRCARCGFENSPTARFCGECAAPLSANTETVSADAPQPPIARATRIAPTERTDAADALEGERKTVTAVFADIKGSTELMEDIDPEEARAIIDPALKLMIDAAHRYDGYVVQSTGDGIFALFGAPVAHEDHPQRALYAALRMQDELKRHSDRVRAEGGLPIQARIGVNTGEVVVRSIHTGAGQTEYTPIGHTTNLASRMQTAAAVGSIAISEATRKLCEGYFTVKALGLTKVKGISEPVNVYEVTGLGPLRTRFQRAAGRGLTKFVGREAELAQMRRALEAARDGHGQIVAATGEPGVGKSRLLFEFKAVAASDCMVLEAYSVSHGKASAYVPVVELLRKYFRIVPEDDPRQRRQKVIGKLLELDDSLKDAVPYVFGLLGIHEGDDPFAQMDAQIRRRRTQDALKRILLRESLNQPLIVVFEDLHWIDSETQALLNLLADSIANARILLLVNYRPEYRHEWGHRTHYTQLRLDPLSAAGAEEMMDALLGDGKDLVALKHLIIERTEGNPFFVEEIVQALFEDGALQRNGSVKLARSMNAVKVPATVQAVLAARIDRLPPEEKELLQALAVIGREFPAGLVRAVAQRTEAALDGMLSHLQGAEFIYEQPAFPEVEYTFKHALTQEVAYKSVLVERRKLLHHQIAEAIESLFAHRLDDHVKQLALHYSRSGDALKAVEYLQRAGQQATSHAFFEEALAQLHAALELLPKLDDASMRDSQELAIRMALLAPLNAINQVAASEIQQNLHRTQVLCEQFGQSQLLGMVLLNLFFVHWSILDLSIAKEYADQTLALAERSTDEIISFVAGFGAGFLSATIGKFSSACEYFQRALRISDETKSLLIKNPYIAFALVNCNGTLGYVMWILGYPDQAVEYHAREVSLISETLGPVSFSLSMHHGLGTDCDFLRDDRGMREQAQRLVDLSREHGLAYFLPIGLIWLGRVMVVEGSIELGLETIAEGRRAMEVLGEVATSQLFSHCIAMAYLAARKTDEGLAFLEEAIAKAAAGGVRMYEADLHRLKGELLLLQAEQQHQPEQRGADQTIPRGASEIQEAQTCFERAIAIAQRQEAKGWELRATISLARLLASRSRHDEARTMLADIYNWFTEGLDTADLKNAKGLLDELSV